MVGNYGIPPESAHNLQQALIHGTLLYRAEISWTGTRKEEKEVKVLTNKMGRASLGVRRTTPVGIITAESALPPARALLDHRQASFALRLMARPVGGGGQEEILEKKGSNLTARIREKCGLSRRETVEAQTLEEFRSLRAWVIVDRKGDPQRIAREWKDHQSTIWTNGSRMEEGAVGVAIVWKKEEEWKGKGQYIGRNKGVFDAETFAVLEAVRTFDRKREGGQHYSIFSDSQVALARVQHDRTGPAQALAKEAIQISESLARRGNTVTIRWVPARLGVEGNEQADALAKRAVEGREDRVGPSFILEASLSHLTRKVTEARSDAINRWIREHPGRRRRYCPPKGGKMRKALAKARKELAGRFYQLLSGHTAMGNHLLRANQAKRDECFWCGSGERQTRFHLFVKCRRWKPEIRRLWQRVRLDSGWGGAPSIRRLLETRGTCWQSWSFWRKARLGKCQAESS